VVPIESEGLAFLLSNIEDLPAETRPKVIPDSALACAATALTGKRALIFDATAVSAEHLELVKRHVADHAATVERAVFLLQDTCPMHREPEHWALKLDTQRYLWAKNRLITRMLDHPLLLDHAQLVVGFDYGDRVDIDHLITAASECGYSYVVGRRGSHVRLSVDGIKPVTEQPALPPNLWFEGVCKLRLVINTAKRELLIIPIVFPGVPLLGIPVGDDCPYCLSALDLGLPPVEHPEGFTTSRCFRRVALKASMLLLEGFLTHFVPRLPGSMPLKVSTQTGLVDSCWIPEGDQVDWEMARARIAEVLLRTDGIRQARLWEHENSSFRFRSDASIRKSTSKGRESLNSLSDWGYVALEVGQWLSEHPAVGNSEDRPEQGIVYSELRDRLRQNLRPFPGEIAVSYSLDLLLDQHVVRPRNIVTGPNARAPLAVPYWVRGYTSAGEHVRQQLLAMAATAGHRNDWFTRGVLSSNGMDGNGV
jgi:hypothetical protein